MELILNKSFKIDLVISFSFLKLVKFFSSGILNQPKTNKNFHSILFGVTRNTHYTFYIYEVDITWNDLTSWMQFWVLLL